MVAHNSSSGVEPEAVAAEAAASPRGDLARAPVHVSRRELGSSASLLSGDCLVWGNPFGFSFFWPCLASYFPLVVVLFSLAITMGRFYSSVTSSPIHLFFSLDSACQAPKGANPSH